MRRRRFGCEFKIEAVHLIKDRGVSVAQAFLDLDVHANELRKWAGVFADVDKFARARSAHLCRPASSRTRRWTRR